jgi:hypothetical protein
VVAWDVSRKGIPSKSFLFSLPEKGVWSICSVIILIFSDQRRGSMMANGFAPCWGGGGFPAGFIVPGRLQVFHGTCVGRSGPRSFLVRTANPLLHCLGPSSPFSFSEVALPIQLRLLSHCEMQSLFDAQFCEGLAGQNPTLEKKVPIHEKNSDLCIFSVSAGAASAPKP